MVRATYSGLARRGRHSPTSRTSRTPLSLSTLSTGFEIFFLLNSQLAVLSANLSVIESLLSGISVVLSKYKIDPIIPPCGFPAYIFFQFVILLLYRSYL